MINKLVEREGALPPANIPDNLPTHLKDALNNIGSSAPSVAEVVIAHFRTFEYMLNHDPGVIDIFPAKQDSKDLQV